MCIAGMKDRKRKFVEISQNKQCKFCTIFEFAAIAKLSSAQNQATYGNLDIADRFLNVNLGKYF